jgi:hypothetical protein
MAVFSTHAHIKILNKKVNHKAEDFHGFKN